MLNFIICDDDLIYRKKVENLIDKYMMKNQIEYKKYLFDDYDKSFMDIVKQELPFKIYILDIEAPTRSGIDMARIIRNKDVKSALIFLTGHQELSQIVLKNEFVFIAFINKFDDSDKRLINSINKAIHIFNQNPIMKFKDNGTQYSIAFDDILYITRDSVERKCIIVTDYAEFKVGKTFTELICLLNDDFIQTHRACFVNQKRVACYNKNKKFIMFDNGTTIDLISTRFNKELV